MSYYNQHSGQMPYGGPPPPQQGYGAPPPGQYGAPPPGQYGAPPQGQYGAPPQGQYGAPPQGQYGAPPQGQYGAPPQGQYGAPPPQHGYSAPPTHQGYGAPPPAQYGAPPPQQGYGHPPPQQGYGALPPLGAYGAPASAPGPYGAPPAGGYALPGGYHAPPAQAGFAPPTPPSPGYGIDTAHIDVTADLDAIDKATKGFGTNERSLITTLAKKDPIQIGTIRSQFDQRFMKSLVQLVAKENSRWFAKGLVEITRGPLVSDCYNLMEAMKGLGTTEVVLDDVLIGRSNADVNAIKAKYQQLFNKSLEKDLRGDLSATTLQMYMMIIAAKRNEESTPVLPHETDAAVTQIQSNLGGFATKDTAHACHLLINKSNAQLRAIALAYEHKFHKPLDDIIKNSFSGHMEDAMRLLIHRAAHRPQAEAIRLEESMAGLGTKNDLLVMRVVRCHWDRQFMAAVAAEYQKHYKKDLVKRIEGETRGDYERLMVACVRP